jgi:hypothetical protein
MDMGKVYEFMGTVSEAMNQTYDYVVEFSAAFIGSIQNVLTVFG